MLDCFDFVQRYFCFQLTYLLSWFNVDSGKLDSLQLKKLSMNLKLIFKTRFHYRYI